MLFRSVSQSRYALLSEKYFSDKIACCDFKGMSCEMIAEELGTLFSLDVVEISEDNENGCILYFEGN